MKKFIILCSAIATLAACAKNDIIATPKQNPIAFGNAFVDNAIRAIDNSYGAVDLTKFNVYATVTGNVGTVQIFNGTEVEGSVGTNIWGYTGTQYWIENATYKFRGIVDATVDSYAAMLPATLKVSADKDALITDVVTRVQETTIDATAVNMQFKHILSKVQFTFKDATADEYTFKVSNIKITNAYNAGTYTLSDGSWSSLTSSVIDFGHATGATNDDIANDAVVTDAVALNATGITSHYAKLVIPGTYSNLQISFDVALFFNGTQISSWSETPTIDSQSFNAGYMYNFVANLEPGKPITFTVTADPSAWITDINGNGSDDDDVSVEL